jgi:hypothetical protein
MAVRVDDVDGNQSVLTAKTAADGARNINTIFAGMSDLTLVSRISTDWYIFAEYLVNFADGHVRRLALTHPVEGGKISGAFGYGRDERKGA